jgi:hypothetical protein
MKKKFHHRKKNKFIFFYCKKIFLQWFFWKIIENRDFRDLTKNGQIWSILTPPHFLTIWRPDTPTLTFCGVGWHNLCADLEFFGGGVNFRSKIIGNSLINHTVIVFVGQFLPPNFKKWGGVWNMTNLIEMLLIISVTGLPLECPHGCSKPGPFFQLVSVSVLQFWGGGLPRCPGFTVVLLPPKRECRPPHFWSNLG